MTQPSFEHIALLQMLDRVQALERLTETLSATNARLSRRIDRLEAQGKSQHRICAGRTEVSK